MADSNTRSTANWTVMVYMAGDNNLRNAAIDDLNEMEVAGSSDEVNIIALLDGNVDGDTKLYYVKKDPNGYHSSIVSEELDAEWMQDELNMGDQKVLINFTNWAIENYPAEHYYLDIWSHGDGWQTGEDWTSDNDLRTYELKYAFAKIKEANSGLKLDIVGFDACRMGLLGVDYQLVDYADIAIGSEKDVEWDGLPYEKILNTLNFNPSMSPMELSETVVEKYIESYEVGSVPSGGYSITLAAVDLRALNSTLHEAFDAFAGELSMAVPYFKSEIGAIRAATEVYEGNQFFDLYHFAQLCKQSEDLSQEIRVKARGVMDAIEEVVIAEGHWNPPDPKQGYANNAHGISIYFDDIELHMDYRTFVISQRTQWNEFLNRYYGDDAESAVTFEAEISVSDDDGLPGNDSIEIMFNTNRTGLNVSLRIYDSAGICLKTVYNQSTKNGIGGSFSLFFNDFAIVSDYYTFSMNLKDSSGILQSYREFEGIWLGNTRPDVMVANLTFYRQDGELVGGESGKHPVENETTTISFTVKNNGDGNITSVAVGLLDGEDLLFEDTFALEVSEEKEVRYYWNGSSGTHDIKVMVDFDDRITEIDENNNEVKETIEIISSYPEKSFIIQGEIVGNDNITLSGVKVYAVNKRTQETIEGRIDNTTYTIIVYPDKYHNGDNMTVIATYEGVKKEATFPAYSEDLRRNVNFQFEVEEENIWLGLIPIFISISAMIFVIIGLVYNLRERKGV